jgi:hypothetical protein
VRLRIDFSASAGNQANIKAFIPGIIEHAMLARNKREC